MDLYQVGKIASFEHYQTLMELHFWQLGTWTTQGVMQLVCMPRATNNVTQQKTMRFYFASTHREDIMQCPVRLLDGVWSHRHSSISDAANLLFCCSICPLHHLRWRLLVFSDVSLHGQALLICSWKMSLPSGGKTPQPVFLKLHIV